MEVEIKNRIMKEKEVINLATGIKFIISIVYLTKTIWAESEDKKIMIKLIEWQNEKTPLEEVEKFIINASKQELMEKRMVSGPSYEDIYSSCKDCGVCRGP